MIYLSVVIPVRNEERFIRDTLRGLLEQDYPRARFEILVVDGMSTDATREIVNLVAAENPGNIIKLFENPKKLSSAGRNVGVRNSGGRVIAVIDGHVSIKSRSLFRDIEGAFERSGALCLGRPAPLDPSVTPGTRGYLIAKARKSPLGHSGASYIYSDFEGMIDPLSSGFAYDRSVFEKVGYFDESFDAAEDVEFHQRLKLAGIMAYTSPELSIPYFPRDNLKGLLRQMRRYGLGRFRLCRKFPSALSPETMIPPSFVAGLLGLAALGAFAPLSLPFNALAAMYLFYLLAITVEGMRVAGPGRRGEAPYIAAALATVHLGLGIGFITGLGELTGPTPSSKKNKTAGNSGRIKIAYVIDRIDSPTAGTEKHLADLIGEIDRKRFEPIFCPLASTGWSDSFDGCRVLPIGFSSFKSPSSVLSIYRFSRFLKSESVDIVQNHFPDGNKVGCIAGWLAGSPAIISTRRNQGYWHTRSELAALKVLNMMATHFLANSIDTSVWAQKTEGLPPEKITVIRNGVSLDRFAPEDEEGRLRARKDWGFPPDAFVAGIVANLRKLKRIDLFLEAAALAAGAEPSARFVVVGDGPERERLENLARNLGIGEKVHFAGLSRDVPKLLAGFDLGVLCSDTESFSNSVAEYMAAGLPVVSTNVGGIREMVSDSENGYLVSAGDPEGLSSAIIRIIRDKSSFEMGRKSRETAEKLLSLSAMTRAFEDYYLRILEAPGPTGGRC